MFLFCVTLSMSRGAYPVGPKRWLRCLFSH